MFTAGFVRGTHGLLGEVKIESASGRYEHLLKLSEAVFQKGDVLRTLSIEKATLAANVIYMKFRGIDCVEDAKKLLGGHLKVSRENACPLKEGEWYVEDLKECVLIFFESDCEKKIGRILDVIEGGGGELLEVLLFEDCDALPGEIKFDSKGRARTVFVPFCEAHIGEIDIQKKTVRLKDLWILE